jgi:hypothetical protein
VGVGPSELEALESVGWRIIKCFLLLAYPIMVTRALLAVVAILTIILHFRKLPGIVRESAAGER